MIKGSFYGWWIVLFLLFVSFVGFAGETPYKRLDQEKLKELRKEIRAEVLSRVADGRLKVEAKLNPQSPIIPFLQQCASHKVCAQKIERRTLGALSRSLIKMLDTVVLAAETARFSIPLGDVKSLEPVIKYYEKEYAIKTAHALLVVLERDSKIIRNRLPSGAIHVGAAFVVGAPKIKKFKLHFVVPDLHEFEEGETDLVIQVEALVTGVDDLANWCVRRLFNDDQIIIVFEDHYKQSPATLMPIVVHELRHYIDYQQWKEFFDDQDERAEALMASYKKDNADIEYEATRKDSEYARWVEHRTKTAKSKLDPQKIRQVIEENFKKIFYENHQFAHAYFGREVERRGWVEQVRFLKIKKDEYGLGYSLERVLAFFRGDTEGTATTPLTPLPPSVKKYFEDIYYSVY